MSTSAYERVTAQSLQDPGLWNMTGTRRFQAACFQENGNNLLARTVHLTGCKWLSAGL
jgi:hypothetical protein